MQIGDAEYQNGAPADIPLASDNDDTNAPTYASFTELANTTLGDHPAQDQTGKVVNQAVNKAGTVTTDTGRDKFAVKYGFFNTETKHNIADKIWDFLNTSGPIIGADGKQTNAHLSDPWFYTTGYAISEPYWATTKIEGKQADVLIQLFERRVVTYVPNAPEGFKVQMGNIGAHYYDWRYKSNGNAPKVFSGYNIEPSTVIPQVAPYQVAKNLTNVTNLSDFTLTPAVKALIETNNFAATFNPEQTYKQFYQLYEDGRYSEKPIFVTTNSVLHVYHLIFDKLLRNTETNYLIADVQELTKSLLAASQAQYEQLKGTRSETAAKRNYAYFAVASKLIDPTFTVPAEVAAEVNADLAQIDAHSGLTPSAVMGINGEEFIEDYGQYVPRGHYTRSEDLKQYFRAMMWYGRITFRLKSADETRSALLLTQALQTAKSGNEQVSTIWDNIYEPTTFFVGGADDLTFRDYAPAMAEIFGPNANAQSTTDDAKIAAFQKLGESFAAPKHQLDVRLH